MQIKISGQQVLLQRSVYNTKKKRCVAKTFESFPLHCLDESDDPQEIFSDEQLSKLTGQELAKLSTWLEDRHNDILKVHHEITAACAEGRIVEAAESIAFARITRDQADGVWFAMNALQSALINAAHPRPVESCQPQILRADSIDILL